ncbi:hypothetical protein VTN77DRAFT_40 [Rasamsonia byssochlamydoides]|uniref:uncharacterized protein n=1 Tax=Rasamsonia byssochlamydoides TaxID=89139 RepID=UPI0037427A82
MKTIEEARRKWDTLFSYGETTSDLKRALKSEERGNPCDEGLRSVCWKAFLLCDDLDRSAWPQRISSSRSAYSSLREHFLKYIEHPDDLQSAIDPLAEDEESPWQALRRDEAIRAEIYQDVERCLQDNHFFREPSTKSRMLDILFVYSKLNPDLGYRQGMHEVLAPILWVVERDAIDQTSIEKAGADKNKDDELMMLLLDARYIEHDSFSLFCSIMQVARAYYEHSDQKTFTGQTDVAPIVSRCQHIHDDLLMTTDRELATHLHAIEILPQIFLTRWIRLLFGREFPFEDVLLIWDLLFADGLRLDLIDFICVAMLLRIRWQLLEADYSSALTLLLRYPSPHPHGPQTLVQDGLYLEQNLSPARGAFIISKYSGRPPELVKVPLHHAKSLPGRKDRPRSYSRNLSEDSSPGRSPARSSHRSLEALFQDVSEGLQRRTEAWGVAKAVRGAVTEARRNMVYSDSGSPATSRPRYSSPRFGSPKPGPVKISDPVDLAKKATLLEKRDRRLAEMLKDALAELRLLKESAGDLDSKANEALNRAYEKVQFVQTSLDSPSTSMQAESTKDTESTDDQVLQQGEAPFADSRTAKMTAAPLPMAEDRTTREYGVAVTSKPPTVAPVPHRPAARPSLAESEFSWMLGDNTSRSSFISSASLPPDQSRHGDVRSKQSPLFGDGRDEGRKRSTGEDDGLALNSLCGGSG